MQKPNVAIRFIGSLAEPLIDASINIANNNQGQLIIDAGFSVVKVATSLLSLYSEKEKTTRKLEQNLQEMKHIDEYGRQQKREIDEQQKNILEEEQQRVNLEIDKLELELQTKLHHLRQNTKLVQGKVENMMFSIETNHRKFRKMMQHLHDCQKEIDLKIENLKHDELKNNREIKFLHDFSMQLTQQFLDLKY